MGCGFVPVTDSESLAPPIAAAPSTETPRPPSSSMPSRKQAARTDSPPRRRGHGRSPAVTVTVTKTKTKTSYRSWPRSGRARRCTTRVRRGAALVGRSLRVRVEASNGLIAEGPSLAQVHDGLRDVLISDGRACEPLPKVVRAGGRRRGNRGTVEARSRGALQTYAPLPVPPSRLAHIGSSGTSAGLGPDQAQ